MGAATISSDVPVGACGIFSVFNAQGGFQTEAGVGATSAPYGITLPVDITGKFDTGVAGFNSTVRHLCPVATRDIIPVRTAKQYRIPKLSHLPIVSQ